MTSRYFVYYSRSRCWDAGTLRVVMPRRNRSILTLADIDCLDRARVLPNNTRDGLNADRISLHACLYSQEHGVSPLKHRPAPGLPFCSFRLSLSGSPSHIQYCPLERDVRSLSSVNAPGRRLHSGSFFGHPRLLIQNPHTSAPVESLVIIREASLSPRISASPILPEDVQLEQKKSCEERSRL